MRLSQLSPLVIDSLQRESRLSFAARKVPQAVPANVTAVAVRSQSRRVCRALTSKPFCQGPVILSRDFPHYLTIPSIVGEPHSTVVLRRKETSNRGHRTVQTTLKLANGTKERASLSLDDSADSPRGTSRTLRIRAVIDTVVVLISAGTV